MPFRKKQKKNSNKFTAVSKKKEFEFNESINRKNFIKNIFKKKEDVKNLNINELIELEKLIKLKKIEINNNYNLFLKECKIKSNEIKKFEKELEENEKSENKNNLNKSYDIFKNLKNSILNFENSVSEYPIQDILEKESFFKKIKERLNKLNENYNLEIQNSKLTQLIDFFKVIEVKKAFGFFDANNTSICFGEFFKLILQFLPHNFKNFYDFQLISKDVREVVLMNWKSIWINSRSYDYSRFSKFPKNKLLSLNEFYFKYNSKFEKVYLDIIKKGIEVIGINGDPTFLINHYLSQNNDNFLIDFIKFDNNFSNSMIDIPPFEQFKLFNKIKPLTSIEFDKVNTKNEIIQKKYAFINFFRSLYDLKPISEFSNEDDIKYDKNILKKNENNKRKLNLNKNIKIDLKSKTIIIFDNIRISKVLQLLLTGLFENCYLIGSSHIYSDTSSNCYLELIEERKLKFENLLICLEKGNRSNATDLLKIPTKNICILGLMSCNSGFQKDNFENFVTIESSSYGFKYNEKKYLEFIYNLLYKLIELPNYYNTNKLVQYIYYIENHIKITSKYTILHKKLIHYEQEITNKIGGQGLSEKSVIQILCAKPVNKREVSKITGIGYSALKKFGLGIVRIVREQLGMAELTESQIKEFNSVF